jgi:NADPH-dependent methylglyoxal reductase
MVTLVTGANGNLASEIIYQLLEKGTKVLGSARSEERTSDLRQVFAKEVADGSLKFVYFSLQDKEGIEKCLKENKDIVEIIHASTAVDFADWQNGIVNATIDGIVSMLEAVKSYAPQVTRFIFTSTIWNMYGAYDNDPQHVYTAKDWSPLARDMPLSNFYLAYFISKVHAEKAAFEFMEKNPGVNFKFKSILTPVVIGPMRIPPKNRKSFNSVLNLVLSAFGGSSVPESLPDFLWGDVRSVATAHIAAADKECPDENSRYLVFNGNSCYPELYKIVSELYPNQEVYVPENPVLPENHKTYENEESVKHLGPLPEFTAQQTLKDLCDQYFATPE